MCPSERSGEVEAERCGEHDADPGCDTTCGPTANGRSGQLSSERSRDCRQAGASTTSRGDRCNGTVGSCATRRTRRGGWRRRARGCRAGAVRRGRGAQWSGSKCGPEGPRGSCGSVASPFVERSQGKERSRQGPEREQEKEEEERPEVTKEKEETELFFKQFEQPVAVTFQQQQQQFQRKLRSEASQMEGGWERQAGELLGSGARGRLEVEEEGRLGGIRGEASWSPDGPLPSRGLRKAVQGQPVTHPAAQGGLGGVVGSSVQWAERDPRHEGGTHDGRGAGFGESPGDREGDGHPLPENPCHPGGQVQRGFLGESRGHRVGEHPEVPGQQWYAGFDERLIRRFRQAMSLRGAVGQDPMGFGAFFSAVVGSLAYALQGGIGLDCSLGQEVHRVHRLLRELNKTSVSPLRGGRSGHSPAHVFPLPPISSGTSRSADRDLSVCPGLLEGANLVVAALNSLFGGQFEAEVRSPPTAAHRRVHARIVCALEAMVLTDEPTLSGVGLDSFLKQSEHYSGGGVVLALGVRGGVPQKAADVCLHEHLRDSFPAMADQVIRPEKLLLPSKRRPRRVKRGYTWLASSYPELVRRNVRAGLHRLKKPHQVARHRGVVCLAGAFAVRKDANEDRVITDPSVNQLLDPAKLPRPRFAYIPKMRTVAVPAGGILVVSKRDARHYFHRLQIGRRWRRWLCGPPIQTTSSTGQDGFRYPASCSAPMGFGPSAGWAQGLTDVIALDAQLPPEQRLHPDTVPPSTMPLWGSIVDDVWAIEHVGSQLDAGVGASWMDAAERAWVARGVEPNSKKSIDNAMGEEIQGYYVDPLEHWVGVSLEKRRWLFQATVWVLRQRRVMVAVVDRLIGKHGFVHSARAIMRSIFAASYSWLDSVRGRRRDLVEIPRKVWVELAISALLLPFCSFNLSAEWSCRVECTDASMSGIGRAWGVVPRNVVQTIARYADHGRVYTNLSLPWSIGLTSEHKCPLRRVRIPVERIKWFTAGAQWMSSHITLGEADAVTWAAADRLRRPADDGNRFVHPLDSAACVGCFTKGRSSSRALNQRCQRMCAIGVAGGHEVFYPWVPSKENPADEPSRRWEPTDEQADEGQPEPSGELLVTGLGCWPNDSKFFIHVCSGPRRDGDLCFWIEKLGAIHELNIIAIHVDPLADTGNLDQVYSGRGRGDLLIGQQALFLLDLIHGGCTIGGFATPPYRTLSRARPRPCRSREHFWEPLASCSVREQRSVMVDSLLYLLCLGLLGELAMEGAWIGLGHPADPGQNFPSFFATEVVKDFCQRFRLRYVEAHQCMYGAMSKKPTGLLLPQHCLCPCAKYGRRSTNQKSLEPEACDGMIGFAPHVGYSSPFCYALAQSCIMRCVSVYRKGYCRPFKPHWPLEFVAKDPWYGLHGLHWKWLEPHPGFLAENLATFNADEISSGIGASEQ